MPVSTHHRPSLLVVEDSPTQAAMLRLVLEDEGFRVRLAPSGEEAAAAIEEEHFDCIISDVVMPGMDGYEFCSLAKKSEQTRDVPLILLTNLSQPEHILKGLECGADNFLSKPYTPSDLISRIRFLCLNRELRQDKVSGEIGMEIFFAGERRLITSEKLQILNHLFQSFEDVLNRNQALVASNDELNRLKRELELRNDELQKLSEERNRLLGVAAHDLRNPLGVVKAYAEFLLNETGELSEVQNHFVGQILDSSEFMQRLVEGLLQFSSVGLSKLTIDGRLLDLEGLIERNVATNRMLAEASKHEIRLECENMPDSVIADPTKIEQVLNNLISNAIRFSSPGTTIDVTAVGTREGAEITVTDRGIGISRERLAAIFEPFETSRKGNPEGRHGTGLGLSIVKRIVEGHGGDIEVHSVLGEGSSFRVRLPLQASQSTVPQPKTS